jgi:dihydropteroate synthase
MQPQIMAILNVTPDSFYAGSRIQDPDRLVSAALRCLDEGAYILDIGACSTRPDSLPASEEEEWSRLEPALRALRTRVPDARLSVDTFRPEIARRALESFGPLIVNDVSGGCEAMFNLVRGYRVPYIWTLRGDYSRLQEIDRMEGIELILDPGLGFTGGVDNDYRCLRQIDRLKAYGRSVLVGVSRKSMLYRLLETTPEDCLAATQVLHLYALQHGATILRVHDVREARQTVRLYEKIEN